VHRHFNAVTSWSLLQYEKRVRVLHARSLLIAGQGKATSIAFGVGYESPQPVQPRVRASIWSAAIARSRERYATESSIAGAPFPC
jgi:AraC-like DNA-binding protein